MHGILMAAGLALAAIAAAPAAAAPVTLPQAEALDRLPAEYTASTGCGRSSATWSGRSDVAAIATAATMIVVTAMAAATVARRPGRPPMAIGVTTTSASERRATIQRPTIPRMVGLSASPAEASVTAKAATPVR